MTLKLRSQVKNHYAHQPSPKHQMSIYSPAITRLRRKLTRHNRHVLLGTAVALLATILVWAGLYFVGKWFILLGLTAAVGDAAFLPDSYPRWFFVYALTTCVGGLIWHSWKRHRPRLRDRPIFGPHLIPDFLFLPADLTFSISANLTAYRRLSPEILLTSHLLLQKLVRSSRLNASEIAQLGLTPELSDEALLTLQYAGLVDLHRGETDWFYTIRSNRLPETLACLESEETV